MEPSFFRRMANAWSTRKWTRRLRKAIERRDLAAARAAIAQGACVACCTGKSPYLGRPSSAPAHRFVAKTALDLAFYWRNEPAMFQLLLEHGAPPGEFRYQQKKMSLRIAVLDTLVLGKPYEGWMRRFGGEVERMCLAFRAQQALTRDTPAANTGPSMLRRL